MRKIVFYTLMSLDGAVDVPSRYCSHGTDDGPPIFDEEMQANEAGVIGRQDAIVLGHRMHDEWSEFWPRQRDNPFADFINTVRKYVVTSSPLTTEWANSEAVSALISGIVARLKAERRGDIGVHASSWRNRSWRNGWWTSCSWSSVQPSASADVDCSRTPATCAGSSS